MMMSGLPFSSHSSWDHQELDDEKWKIFSASLEKVQMQVHPNLKIDVKALEYIEVLIISLLKTLSNSRPTTIQDVDEQVQSSFPHPIDTWAISEARHALERRKHNRRDRGVTLPVDRVHPLLKELKGYRLDHQVTLYMVAILEYVAADILKLVGNYVRNMNSGCAISEEDVRVSVKADKALSSMFFPSSDSSDDGSDGSLSGGYGSRRLASTTSLLDPALDTVTIFSYQSMHKTYEDLVKNMINSEQHFIRETELVIRVFRAPFVELFPGSKDIESIFSNILEIRSFSRDFLGALEDVVEVTGQNQIPFVGGCFEDMTEGAEFDVYDTYIEDVLSPRLKDRLYALLKRSDLTAKLNELSPGFREVTKYVLPMLLEMPLRHLKRTFDTMQKLKECDQSTEEDIESCNQALSSLNRLRSDLERRLHQINSIHSAVYFSRRVGSDLTTERHVSAQTILKIQHSIENWEGREIDQISNYFIMEGTMFVMDRGKKKERHLFLFDNMVLICKPVSSQGVKRQRYKDKYLLKNIEVIDIEDEVDSDVKDYSGGFEIRPKNQASTVIHPKTYSDKVEWMTALLTLLNRSNLDKMVDAWLSSEEVPLVLPPVDTYEFAQQDSDSNISLEESGGQTAEPPLIQGATLIKLIERLTYHMYADPTFVQRFLTTYRSFCSPKELLTLLISRFQIPLDEQLPAYQNRDTLSRFKKEYVKPVQFRVLNVVRLWVDQHFYDFEREEKLLQALEMFLSTIRGKVMRKWVDSIMKILKRRVESSLFVQGIAPDATTYPLAQFNETAPPTEWHTALQDEEEKYNLITLHPIEIARQETLIQFWLYKSVKPSELVGSVFTKKNKEKQCPNLMKLIRQTNRFIYWLESSILNTRNLDERIALVSRIIEIMLVFHRLNNFNGVLSVVSALDSAAVYRLSATLDQIKPSLKAKLEEAKELKANNYKRYFDLLRAIDPPCVPFFGIYLTNILKLEEGNPDYLRDTQLINFNKRRRVAEIIAEIQQYQNQPYNITTVPHIQNFLEKVDPWEGRTDNDLQDHLFDVSKEIEPRDKPPTKASRKYDTGALKSPGIKPTSHKSVTPSTNKHVATSYSSSQSDASSHSSGHGSSRFSFNKSSITDEDEIRSTISSTPPLTPSSLPITPPPRTPPYNHQYLSHTSLHSHGSGLGSKASLISSSTIGASGSVIFAGSTNTLVNHNSMSQLNQATNQLRPHEESDEEFRQVINLQPPPLPPRLPSRSSLSQPPHGVAPLPREALSSYGSVCSVHGVPHAAPRSTASLSHSSSFGFAMPSSPAPHSPAIVEDAPPLLPPKPHHHSRQNSDNSRGFETTRNFESSRPELSYRDGGMTIEGESFAPRLPPRRSARPGRTIERSGSMPSSDQHRYSRRNSGDHVNMTTYNPPITPQLPPRTYKPNHNRQRSQ